MKKLAISILCVLGLEASAQQMQQLSQYLQNPYLINPAAAGLTDFVDLNLSFRQQWVGFENSPQTFYFSGNSTVGRISSAPKYSASLRTSRNAAPKNTGIRTGKMRHAVGGNIMMDNYGAFGRLMFNGSYAIHIPITKGMNIAAGVGLGMSNMRFIQDRVTMLDPNDNTYATFLGNSQKRSFFDVFTGVYLYTEALTVGYSNAQLMQNKLYYGDPTDAKLNMHHFFMAGYRIAINDDFSLTPNVLLKYMNPAPAALDINLNANYQDKITGGFSYRHKDAIVGFLGVMFSNFKIGYSYDYTISTLRKMNSGGHEIVVGYKIKI